MRPRDARREADLLKLKEDNFTLGDYWILHSGDHVTVTHQAVGSSPIAQIKIPRQTFNGIVDWYTREQHKRLQQR